MRIKVAHTLGNRAENTDKDERVLNGYVEAFGKEDTEVLKRPGLLSSFSLAVGQASATTGQGLFVMNVPSAPGVPGTNSLVGIRGDVLTIPL